jgi:hypothetical protein
LFFFKIFFLFFILGLITSISELPKSSSISASFSIKEFKGFNLKGLSSFSISSSSFSSTKNESFEYSFFPSSYSS